MYTGNCQINWLKVDQPASASVRRLWFCNLKKFKKIQKCLFPGECQLVSTKSSKQKWRTQKSKEDFSLENWIALLQRLNQLATIVWQTTARYKEYIIERCNDMCKSVYFVPMWRHNRQLTATRITVSALGRLYLTSLNALDHLHPRLLNKLNTVDYRHLSILIKPHL